MIDLMDMIAWIKTVASSFADPPSPDKNSAKFTAALGKQGKQI